MHSYVCATAKHRGANWETSDICCAFCSVGKDSLPQCLSTVETQLDLDQFDFIRTLQRTNKQCSRVLCLLFYSFIFLNL